MASAAASLLRGRSPSSRAARSKVLEICLLVLLLIALGALLVLLVEVLRGAQTVFSERGSGILRAPLSSLPERAGMWQGIQGSVLTCLFVVVIAFPLGIGSAVYLEEYAGDTQVTRFITVNVRNLAGVPSIVYGLLGLAVFVTTFKRFTGGATIISAGLTLAALVLPIVIITTAEALRAVPDTIRQGAFALGATRWQVVRRQVIPSATPGILTGSVLAISRALGETAPLLLVGSVTGFLASGDGGIGEQLRSPFTSLPTIVFAWARQPNAGFQTLTSAAIVVLLGVILLANAVAIILRDRYDRRW
jgi:phosphate transport system permease protein